MRNVQGQVRRDFSRIERRTAARRSPTRLSTQPRRHRKTNKKLGPCRTLCTGLPHRDRSKTDQGGSRRNLKMDREQSRQAAQGPRSRSAFPNIPSWTLAENPDLHPNFQKYYLGEPAHDCVQRHMPVSCGGAMGAGGTEKAIEVR